MSTHFSKIDNLFNIDKNWVKDANKNSWNTSIIHITLILVNSLSKANFEKIFFFLIPYYTL